MDEGMTINNTTLRPPGRRRSCTASNVWRRRRRRLHLRAARTLRTCAAPYAMRGYLRVAGWWLGATQFRAPRPRASASAACDRLSDSITGICTHEKKKRASRCTRISQLMGLQGYIITVQSCIIIVLPSANTDAPPALNTTSPLRLVHRRTTYACSSSYLDNKRCLHCLGLVCLHS